MNKYYLNGNDWGFKEFLGEDWIWRNSEKRKTNDIRWWKKGSVPSSVTYDLWMLKEIPDPYYEKNSLLIEWIPERTWIYKKTFNIPKEFKDKTLTLTFEGVDYSALFYLNDKFLGEHNSMFTPISFDITNIISFDEENVLSVVLNKAPDEQPQVSKTRYVTTHKSRMTYWWDFCPRMIHIGIWDDVHIEASNSIKINQITVDANNLDGDVSIKLELNSNLQQKANLQLTAEINNIQQIIYIEEELIQGDNIINCNIKIENPKLWFPNGYGEQALYKLNVKVLENSNQLSDEKEIIFGIRNVKFLKNDGAEEQAKPYTVCVNGKIIYMKGWNWVPIDVLYGVKREEKLKRLLTLAREANVNILRVWGGGLIEREDFYNLCDEYGIMVWQEFIQSSSGIENKPSEAPEFLKLMAKEAKQIVPRKKNHPSLVIWCGGNELQSGIDLIIKDTEPVIKILNDIVIELDTRYFLPSSPSGRVFNNNLENIKNDPMGLHDVHGPWEHQGLIKHYTLYNQGTSLLSSEFGVEGMTNYNTLLKSMNETNLWPPSRDNEYYFHRGSWWNNYPLIQECFNNEIKDIETIIKASQFIQFEGLRYAVESNRRRAMNNSGTFPWQFNEPYPNNTCTSSVDYYANPKPAYYAVAKAYEKSNISAKFKSQTVYNEKEFEAEIFYQYSGDEVKVNIKAELVGVSGKVFVSKELEVTSSNEIATLAGKINCLCDIITDDIFFLVLYAENKNKNIISENRYLFTKTNTLSPLLHVENTTLKVTKQEDKINIRNTGKTTAIFVKLEDNDLDNSYLYFSKNCLYILPNESIDIIAREERKDKLSVKISGFNIENIIL